MIRTFRYGEVSNEELFIRSTLIDDVAPVVADIIENVRQRGDAALFEYTERFDKAKLETLLVSREEIEQAVDEVGEDYLAVLKKAADNIAEYHRNQIRTGFMMERRRALCSDRR